MYGLLLIFLGGVNLFYSYKFLKDEKFAKAYISKSPKALIWRKMLGEKKALKVTRTIFAPLGLVLGSLFVLAGIYFLAK